MTKKTTEDEVIKVIAEALRTGATLLNAACPICSTLLVKIKDKIYCKACNKEVLIYRDESELPKEIQKALKKVEEKKPQSEDSKIVKTLKEKAETLRLKLEQADDTDEIIKLTEALEKIQNTLKKMVEE